ncbi:HET-domain-containing protein [Cenococcum geophilum 1.58]|uniref:HET-domain-containing protein n=1 Tax=Cenococcum geophilum 1.58 TaxID=794803 RepID=UPI00358E7065|nr:HET-domain-containing protein [Cenococcum geophilum 1.58]
MRLLDARTITLRSFVSKNEVPQYAILSHTWGLEEVTFDDLNGSDPGQLHGYKKIIEACRQTYQDGIHYLWMDTCCIDKRSSSELSEAINSMFKWYQAAAVCYAYLQDVEETQFAKSRWWTRGWTLQELIAPSELIFCDKFFRRIGSKKELVRVISVISGIDEAVLLHKLSLKDVCVATRMSWAAKRKTTRIEDIAYSLINIFGIDMAMLYGEGNRAFIRLQEEIIKSTNDQSIFAWNGYNDENGSCSLLGHHASGARTGLFRCSIGKIRQSSV